MCVAQGGAPMAGDPSAAEMAFDDAQALVHGGLYGPALRALQAFRRTYPRDPHAPQALFLLNNPFALEASERAADRILEQDLPDESARVRYAYACALCRYPTESESTRALKFLASGGDHRAAWGAFTQALFSAAEFRYLP